MEVNRVVENEEINFDHNRGLMLPTDASGSTLVSSSNSNNEEPRTDYEAWGNYSQSSQVFDVSHSFGDFGGQQANTYQNIDNGLAEPNVGYNGTFMDTMGVGNNNLACNSYPLQQNAVMNGGDIQIGQQQIPSSNTTSMTWDLLTREENKNLNYETFSTEPNAFLNNEDIQLQSNANPNQQNEFMNEGIQLGQQQVSSSSATSAERNHFDQYEQNNSTFRPFMNTLYEGIDENASITMSANSMGNTASAKGVDTFKYFLSNLARPLTSSDILSDTILCAELMNANHDTTSKWEPVKNTKAMEQRKRKHISDELKKSMKKSMMMIDQLTSDNVLPHDSMLTNTGSVQVDNDLRSSEMIPSEMFRFTAPEANIDNFCHNDVHQQGFPLASTAMIQPSSGINHGERYGNFMPQNSMNNTSSDQSSTPPHFSGIERPISAMMGPSNTVQNRTVSVIPSGHTHRSGMNIPAEKVLKTFFALSRYEGGNRVRILATGAVVNGCYLARYKVYQSNGYEEPSTSTRPGTSNEDLRAAMCFIPDEPMQVQLKMLHRYAHKTFNKHLLCSFKDLVASNGQQMHSGRLTLDGINFFHYWSLNYAEGLKLLIRQALTTLPLHWTRELPPPYDQTNHQVTRNDN